MLTAKVYTAQGQLVSNQIVYELLSLSTSEKLDEIGTFSFTVSTSREWAAYFQQKRRVVIEWYDSLREARYEVANGFIEKRSYDRNSRAYRIDCVDLLDEWTRQPVGFNRRIDVDPIGQVLDTFAQEVAVPSGATPWGAITTPSDNNVVGMLAGTSYYAALLEILRRFKWHVRRNKTQGRAIEVGAFGEDCGVHLYNADFKAGMAGRMDIAILGNLTILETSITLVNRIYGMGESLGTSVLDWKGYSGTSEYPVYSEVRGGKTLYYIEDKASVGEYGLHAQVLKDGGIGRQGSSNTDKFNAQRQLHQRFVSYLQLASVPQVAYGLTVELLPPTVKIGDRIHLRYNGNADRRDYDGIVRDGDLIDADDDLFIVGITRNWRPEGGVSYDLEVSNLDRLPASSLGLMISQVSQAEVYRTLAEPKKQTLVAGVDTITDQIFTVLAVDPSSQPRRAKIEIEFDDEVLILHKAILYVETDNGQSASNDILINGNPRREYSIPYYLSIFINDYDIGTNLQTVDEISGTTGIDPNTITDEYAGKTIVSPPPDAIWGTPDTATQFKFNIKPFLENEDGSVNRKHKIEVYNAQSSVMGTGVLLGTPSEIPSFGTVRFSYIVEITTKQDAEE